jgi:hypothetical protein
MKRLTYVFNNSTELKKAQKTLLDRGYELDEIKINPGELIEDREKKLVPAYTTGNSTLRKSMHGLKIGIIAGAVLVGIVVGFILVFESEKSLSPIATLITSILIGAVWGGVLGFMLGSLFPLELDIKTSKQSNLREYSVDFLPHNPKDELYFRNQWEVV